ATTRGSPDRQRRKLFLTGPWLGRAAGPVSGPTSRTKRRRSAVCNLDTRSAGFCRTEATSCRLCLPRCGRTLRPAYRKVDAHFGGIMKNRIDGSVLSFALLSLLVACEKEAPP